MAVALMAEVMVPVGEPEQEEEGDMRVVDMEGAVALEVAVAQPTAVKEAMPADMEVAKEGAPVEEEVTEVNTAEAMTADMLLKQLRNSILNST
uniref:Uncharacterized protein n=1 Tax=Kalanchoe fedtschenkoi TaxID=63787 RepID=A0A7N0UYF8_KALFE